MHKRALPAFVWECEGFRRCLSLVDVRSLSLTCKDWQHAVVAIYSAPQARQLIKTLASSIPAVQIALERTISTGENVQHAQQALLHELWTVVDILQSSTCYPWGHDLAATPGLVAGFSHLFTVPNMRWHIAQECLQQLDVRINYRQLLQAAHNRVAGVEVWVQIQHELGLETDIPDIAVTACLENLDLHKLEAHAMRPDGDEDILQLMLNRRPTEYVEHIATMLLPKVHDAATMMSMLLTAITRKHINVLQTAITLPLVQQLEMTAVLQLMQTDVAVRTPYHCYGVDYDRSAMHLLVRLPAATALRTNDIRSLMETALARSCDAAQQVVALCGLPAAQQLPLADCVQMLRQSTCRSLDTAVVALCSLPAASNMNQVDVWFGIMSAAVADHPYCTTMAGSAVQALCKLPAARHAHVGMLMELLITAVKFSGYAAVVALCALPAVHSISVDDVLILTQRVFIQLTELPSAVTSEDLDSNSQLGAVTAAAGLAALGKLAAVQRMSTAQLLELFNLLVWDGNYQPGLDWLQSLPAACDVPVDYIIQQSQVAVQQQNAAWLQALCSFPTAGKVDAETLLRLFVATCQCESDASRAVQQVLCKLVESRYPCSQ